MRHIFLLVAISMAILLITSCDNYSVPENLAPEDFVTVKINDQYQIDLPKYLSKTDELNDEASLQYMNELKEAYAIVIDESKTEFELTIPPATEGAMDQSTLEYYADLQLASFESIVMIDAEAEKKKASINGLKAEICELSGTLDGIGIKYYFGFFESPTHMYMVILWTLKSRQVRYEETFLTSLESFKVLKP